MANTLDAASILLWLDNGTCQLNHQQIQKLLFIANGYHLAIYDEPLINDELPIIWKYGVIWNELYHKLKHFGGTPLCKSYFKEVETTKESEIEVLRSTLDRYGKFCPVELSQYANLATGMSLANGSHYQPQTVNLELVKAYYLDRLLGARARDSAADAQS
ncbi:Panacea domain-containing protein [Vibrio coralliirubri]|uniref:Panacea domain-containing protein n=1 Tax=Vibrio coralliirubri TaxID=1516159 RepID=UPI00228523BC|nr:Panacea domain-containing protein [Vibrio coralliirubri]MCY9861475.1 Panacea domain-containing protein [Vibrio coralliirubri]